MSRPICVGEDGDHQVETDIAEIHLVFPKPKDFERYRRLMGKKVNVTGKLTPRTMSHHHTAVIMTAEKVSDAGRHRLTRSRGNQTVMSYGPPTYSAEITFDALTGRIEKRAWFGASSAELQPVDSYVEHFFVGAADVLWAACGERYTVAATGSATGPHTVSKDEPGSGNTVHGVVLGREGQSSITLRCEDPTQQAATRVSPPPPPLSLLSGATVVQPTRIWYKIFPAGVRSRIIGPVPNFRRPGE